jgi:hydroxyacylglutathione hydrolase
MVHIEKLTLGVLQANCYLVQCAATRQTAVIDPGLEPERILARLHALGDPPVAAILATHGHFDHVVGVRAIKRIRARRSGFRARSGNSGRSMRTRILCT